MTEHRTATDAAQDSEAGFTLLELIVVMIIIGVLSAFAVPAFSHHLKVAREAVLKEDLHTMRQAIDSYTVDKQKAPDSLDDVVRSGYLKVMPMDPTTHRTDSWTTDRSDAYRSVDETSTGINDVHSGSQELSTEGTIYSTW
jgi:general secretion pathway protein G